MHLTITEEWRAVVGYEGAYEVSNLGRVRSCTRTVRHPMKGRVVVLGRLMSPTVGKNGYWKVGLSREGKRRTMNVHVLVLTAFVGPRPPGMEACHGPSGCLDNSVENLRWDTPSENRYDSVRDGTHPFAARDTCKFEHHLLEPNLVRSRLPKRTCLACHSGGCYVRAAAKRGVVLDLRSECDRRYAEIMKESSCLSV